MDIKLNINNCTLGSNKSNKSNKNILLSNLFKLLNKLQSDIDQKVLEKILNDYRKCK